MEGKSRAVEATEGIFRKEYAVRDVFLCTFAPAKEIRWI
jgi:hypothetical protein